MERIMGGAFLLARKIFESKFWNDKKSTWKIIWIYIIGKVYFEEGHSYEKGEGFFNFKEEYKKISKDISYDTVKRFLAFARKEGMISTHQSTYGITIKVLKYSYYQELSNYASTTNRTQTALRPHSDRTSNIEKNDNNDNNEKKHRAVKKTDTLTKPAINLFCERYRLHFGVDYLPKWGKEGALMKTVAKAVPLNELALIIDKFFQETDEFIKKAGYTIAVFSTRVNQLRRPKTERERIREEMGL